MSDLNTQALFQEAAAHAQAGRFAQSRAALERLLQVDPNHADAMHALGMINLQLGRRAEAIEMLRRAAVATNPPPAQLFGVRYNLALMLWREGRASEALEHVARAVESDEGGLRKIDALNLMGNCYRDLGQLEDSIAMYRRVLALDGANAMAYLNLAVSLQDQGKLSEAIGAYERALELKNGRHALTHSDLLLCLNYSEEHTAEQVFEAHRAFARVYEPTPLPARPLLRRSCRPQAQERIRIGYLSPDFRGHSVAFFIWPVLGQHDRSRFAVTCYSDAAAGTADEMTEMLRRTPERWCDVSRMSDEQLAAQVRADEIDILVELTGHTPRNRLPLLARERLAPVQVTYLGYPNTTGLSTIDYRITDAVQDPPGMTEAFHSEQLVRLPKVFFTQVTIADLPEVSPLPGAVSGRVTFAVFTNFCKVRPMMMKLWARILREVEGSKLVIQARSLRDRATRESVMRFFQDEGIESGRLELREFVEFHEYIGMYAGVDIVLDTFPFNGHTTSCQALWMGVPVVTLAGQVSRSRMGASVLGAIGLSELVAASGDEYVRIAVELASDLPRLGGMRSGLRERIAKSPILDCTGFTRDLESAYVEMIGKLADSR